LGRGESFHPGKRAPKAAQQTPNRLAIVGEGAIWRPERRNSAQVQNGKREERREQYTRECLALRGKGDFSTIEKDDAPELYRNR